MSTLAELELRRLRRRGMVLRIYLTIACVAIIAGLSIIWRI